jgi:hypothetical protein
VGTPLWAHPKSLDGLGSMVVGLLDVCTDIEMSPAAIWLKAAYLQGIRDDAANLVRKG